MTDGNMLEGEETSCLTYWEEAAKDTVVRALKLAHPMVTLKRKERLLGI